ncbi:hypothetical protein EKK58_10635 [Candidatus Dependentiae bacterium]|nr:MAG: hypothetical protein EKK58_10635 [Candidatus Dependentiae bacterium]
MENIARAALALKFPNVDVSNLMEVINATPNPQMAVEILLDCYKPQRIPYQVKTHKGETRTKVGVDYWNSIVKYTSDKSDGLQFCALQVWLDLADTTLEGAV